MRYLRVATAQEATGAGPEFAIAEELVCVFFNSYAATRAQVEQHCTLVWNDEGISRAGSHQLFIRGVTKPVDNPSLVALRN